MCQVGVRCYADSSKKLKSELQKLSAVNEKLGDSQTKLRAAALDGDFNAYAAARENITRLHEQRNKIVFERNSAQRDVDGTKRGKAMLDELMLNSRSSEEFNQYRIRKNQGEATAFVRSYSAELKKSGRKPVLFLPGEKKPAARLAG